MWETQGNSFQSTLICFVLEIHTWFGNTSMTEKKGFWNWKDFILFIPPFYSFSSHFTSEYLKIGKVR